jgi:hypothetical protein
MRFLRTLPRGHLLAILILVLLSIYATLTSTVRGAALVLV